MLDISVNFKTHSEGTIKEQGQARIPIEYESQLFKVRSKLLTESKQTCKRDNDKPNLLRRD